MGQLQDQPDREIDGADKPTETLLKSAIRQLKNQQQTLQSVIEKLQQDIEQIKTEQQAQRQQVNNWPTNSQQQVQPQIPVASVTPPLGNELIKGVGLVLLYSLLMSLQNVVTRVILKEQSIFGMFKLGGFISPSPGNSLLILFIRVALAAPIMAFGVAPLVYPNTWRDIKQLLKPKERPRLWFAIISGVCLFLSQFFIYIALGNIPTGVATTIFFIYPLVTILLEWLLFEKQPTSTLILAMVTICIGGYLTIPNLSAGANNNIGLGAATAIASGVTFALYLIFTKLSKLKGAPVSVISFSTILVLSWLGLLVVGYDIDGGMWPKLVGAGVVLALTTLFGYLFNNMGIFLLGPTLASVIGASGPAFTVILALLLIQESLQINQWIGVGLVTLWVLGISLENRKRQA